MSMVLQPFTKNDVHYVFVFGLRNDVFTPVTGVSEV